MMVRKITLTLVAGVLLSSAGVVSAQSGGTQLAPVVDRTGGVATGDGSTTQTFGTAGNAGSLESRVARLERFMENQALVDMMMRLDSMQSTMQTLQGQVEELTFELKNMEQRQRDLYLDIDRRMRQMEVAGTPPSTGAAPGSSASAPVTAPQAGAATVATVAAAAQAADPALEREAYQKAFQELKNGRYDQAITAFQSFLASYPAGSYADNAQYWLGEANYVTRRFQAAESEFKKVLERHPDSSKVADALLKLGFTYYELGNWDAARKNLNDVKSRFPNTTVAKLADNRLQKMRLEGR